MDITADPRFAEGVRLFNAGEYLDASECFEDLFFEGVRDEPEFVRIFLQFAVGIHHAEMKQVRPAVERIEEGLRVVAKVRDDRGIDLQALAHGMRSALHDLLDTQGPAPARETPQRTAALQTSSRAPKWPQIRNRA